MAHRPDSLVIRNRVETKTVAQKEIFIAALKRLANVSVAIEVTGLSRFLVYQWRKEDVVFKEQWEHAIDFAAGSLESAIYLKLAQALTDNKHKVTMPEAKLAEFILAGMMPDKYKRTGFDVEINQLNITINWSDVPDDMLAKYNNDQLTMQDIYEWQVQSKEQAKSTTGED